MGFSIELIVSDPSGPSPAAGTPATQRLPLVYDTIEAARAAGEAFLTRNEAPPGTLAYQVVDEGGDIVVAPRAGP